MKITFSEGEVLELLDRANLKLRRARITPRNSQQSLAHSLAVTLNEELMARAEDQTGKEVKDGSVT
jgi:hypothetical protein